MASYLTTNFSPAIILHSFSTKVRAKELQASKYIKKVALEIGNPIHLVLYSLLY
jgi:hypothetical protein